MATNWRGTREALRRAIGRFLKPLRRKLAFLFKIVRDAKFTAIVAGTVLAGDPGMVGAAPIELSDITAGIGGFTINGEAANDRLGNSVSAAGDVNGDGLADLIIGTRSADPHGPGSGRSYVVFGKPDGALAQLSDVTAGMGGFAIDGEAAYDRLG